MTYFYHVRPTKVRRGKPIMLPLEALENQTGFASLYGVNNLTKAKIQRVGHLRDLHQVKLFADKIVIDFDDSPIEAENFWRKCKENKWAADLYLIGGWHSAHVVLSHKDLFELDLNLRHKEWARLNAPGCDLSIYKPSGIIRCEGNQHETRIGEYKEWTAACAGADIELPPIPERKLSKRQYEARDDIDEEEAALDNMIMTAIAAPGRNNFAYGIAKKCAEIGKEFEYAERILDVWNRIYCNPPLGQEKIEHALRSGYR